MAATLLYGHMPQLISHIVSTRYIAVHCLTLLLLLITDSAAQYTEFKRESRHEPVLRIVVTKKFLTIEAIGEHTDRLQFQRADLTTAPSVVRVGERILIDSAGFHLSTCDLPGSAIAEIGVEKHSDSTIIVLSRYTGAADASYRARRGNRVSFDTRVEVNQGDYCRGFILSVLGNIIIDGEVQKDVVSLFGNIIVGPSAVIRGDIATVNGEVQITRQASVYGNVYYERESRKFRSQRYRDRSYFSYDLFFRYNRVDGATPALGIRFDDPDSVLPSIWLNYGYACESRRIRFAAGFDQPLYRQTPVFVGAEMFQRLGSDDNSIIDDVENTVFALCFTEDFKDFYEARGGWAWLRLQDSGHWTIATEFCTEETRWFDANRNLFSLFGGDKTFIPNFGHAPSDLRNNGIKEIDSSRIAELRFRSMYDSRSNKDDSFSSAWIGEAALDWSNPDIGSDFDYRRYWGSLTRQFRVNQRALFLIRITGGGSDGYLPLYRRFTLGGLGTLRGYRHKEFWGSQYWYSNVEYRLSLPKSPVSLGIVYDAGQIANDERISSRVEVKQSIGAVAYFVDDDFSISFSHRLDGVDKPALQIFARLRHSW